MLAFYIMFLQSHAIIGLPELQNNIAEVEELQADLMEEDILEHILSLLQDSQVDVGVRYFAGGILAHLASRPDAWTLENELRSTVLKQLVCVCVLNAALHVRSTTFCEYAFLSRQHDSIMTWTHLEREMVSYR